MEREGEVVGVPGERLWLRFESHTDLDWTLPPSLTRALHLDSH